VKCWVCKRQARGFGHTDPRYGVGDPRRYPIDWVFCSRRCQDAFHMLCGRALAQDGDTGIREVAMFDPSDIELGAMRRCLKSFGEAAGEIGFDKPLGAYSEAEALRVIDAIVTGYTLAMVEHHEATKASPVRGGTATPDPLAAKPSAGAAHAFADMPDDLPWEATR
jgi:hypothetical protein